MDSTPDYTLKTIINTAYKPVVFRLKGKKHYQVYLQIHSTNDPQLNKLKKVDYLLHPTFKKRKRTSTNREDFFQIDILTWGLFVIKITLFFEDGQTREMECDMRQDFQKMKMSDF